LTPADTQERLLYELGSGQWNIPELRTLLERVLSGSKPFKDYEVNAAFDTIGARNMLLNARPIGRHRTPYSHPPVQKLASTRGTARPVCLGCRRKRNPRNERCLKSIR